MFVILTYQKFSEIQKCFYGSEFHEAINSENNALCLYLLQGYTRWKVFTALTLLKNLIKTEANIKIICFAMITLYKSENSKFSNINLIAIQHYTFSIKANSYHSFNLKHFVCSFPKHLGRVRV